MGSAASKSGRRKASKPVKQQQIEAVSDVTSLPARPLQYQLQTKLHVEIIDLILIFLEHSNSLQTLARLALASKAFYILVVPHLYRQLIVDSCSPVLDVGAHFLVTHGARWKAQFATEIMSNDIFTIPGKTDRRLHCLSMVEKMTIKNIPTTESALNLSRAVIGITEHHKDHQSKPLIFPRLISLSIDPSAVASLEDWEINVSDERNGRSHPVLEAIIGSSNVRHLCIALDADQPRELHLNCISDALKTLVRCNFPVQPSFTCHGVTLHRRIPAHRLCRLRYEFSPYFSSESSYMRDSRFDQVADIIRDSAPTRVRLPNNALGQIQWRRAVGKESTRWEFYGLVDLAWRPDSVQGAFHTPDQYAQSIRSNNWGVMVKDMDHLISRITYETGGDDPCGACGRIFTQPSCERQQAITADLHNDNTPQRNNGGQNSVPQYVAEISVQPKLFHV